jgi:hypothetical protein
MRSRTSLDARIQKLEAREPLGNPGRGPSPREWQRYFFAAENAQRQRHGLEPLPELPYTQEDRENDLDTLENVLPAYRAAAGWEGEKAQETLNAWEQQLKERIHRKDTV